jgi:hypothetical protein
MSNSNWTEVYINCQNKIHWSLGKNYAHVAWVCNLMKS